MTRNQIAYHQLNEDIRANKAREHENRRHNEISEKETVRHNRVSEFSDMIGAAGSAARGFGSLAKGASFKVGSPTSAFNSGSRAATAAKQITTKGRSLLTNEKYW